ncbi:hypothetical protein HK097_006190 [Rhizophlyctis rosea]|uniref:Uncharacterized protein n=1 Tax=Rhizophlyctis rosea TaxID=64517 RepID=A0AAD5X2X4_9FUNG|nr:hypothetical protein HK097_006190 [Rhizophlyctis rosea]
MASPSTPDFPVRTVHFSADSLHHDARSDSGRSDDDHDFFDDLPPLHRPRFKPSEPRVDETQRQPTYDHSVDEPKPQPSVDFTYAHPTPPAKERNAAAAAHERQGGSNLRRGGGMAGFRNVRPSSAPPARKRKEALDPHIVEVYTKAMQSLSRTSPLRASPKRRPTAPHFSYKEPEALQEELNHAKQTINGLQQEKKELMTRVRILEQESTRMDKKYQDMLIVNSLSSSTAARIVPREDKTITDLKTVLRSYKKQNKELEGQIDALKKRFELKRMILVLVLTLLIHFPSTRFTKLAESQIECRVYFQENIGLKRLLQQHGKSPDDKLVDETSEQLLQYDQTIDELTNRLNEIEAENEEMKAHLSKLQNNLSDSSHTTSSLRDELASVHEHYRALDALHKSTLVELDQTKIESDKLREKLEGREKDLSSSRDECAMVRKEKEEVEGRTRDLERRAEAPAELEKAIASGKEVHAQAARKHEATLHQLEEMTRTKEGLDRDLEHQRSQTAILSNEIDTLQSTHQTALAELQKSHSRAVSTLTEEHQQTIDALRAEISQWKRKCDDAEERERRAREQSKDVENMWMSRLEVSEKMWKSRNQDVESDWEKRYRELEERLNGAEERRKDDEKGWQRQVEDLKFEVSNQALAVHRLETQRDLLTRECEGYQISYTRATQQITDLQRRLQDLESKHDSRSRGRRQHDDHRPISNVAYRQKVNPSTVSTRPELSIYDESDLLSSRRSSLPFSRSTSASSLSRSVRGSGNEGHDFERMDSSDSRFTEKMNLRMSRIAKDGSRETEHEQGVGLPPGGDRGFDKVAYIEDTGRSSEKRVFDSTRSIAQNEFVPRDGLAHRTGSIHDIGSTEEIASPSPEPEALIPSDVQADLVDQDAESQSAGVSDPFSVPRKSLEDFIVHEVTRSVVSLVGGEHSKHASRAASIHSRRPSAGARTHDAGEEHLVNLDSPTRSMIQLAPDPGPRLSSVDIRPPSKSASTATSKHHTTSPPSPASTRRSSLLRSRSRSQPHSLSRSTSRLSQGDRIESPAASVHSAKLHTPPPRSPSVQHTRTPSPQPSHHESPFHSRTTSIESFQPLSAPESEPGTPTLSRSVRSSSPVPSLATTEPTRVSESRSQRPDDSRSNADNPMHKRSLAGAPANDVPSSEHVAVDQSDMRGREEMVADDREDGAARKIQKTYRKFLARKRHQRAQSAKVAPLRLEPTDKEREEAAIKIQALARGRAVRRQKRREREAKALLGTTLTEL